MFHNQKMTALAALFFLGLALPAAEAQFGRLGSIVKKAEGLKPMTTEEEIAMGREVAARMIGYFKVWENEKAASYVRKVGHLVAMQADRQDVKYHFEVLDTDDVNAFAAPGGYIFITRGLFEVLGSEAELAGVLGHEVGHVAGKHIVNELQRNKTLSAGISVAASYAPGSQYLNQMAGKLVEKMIEKGLEPGDEHDADKRGVALAYAAGYSPDGMKNALLAMKRITVEEKTSWLNRTHPPLDDRLKRVEQQMAGTPAEGRPTLAERYQTSVK